VKAIINEEIEAIKESKRGLAEIFCNMLKDVEVEDVMKDLTVRDGNDLISSFNKNGRHYYLSIDVKSR